MTTLNDDSCDQTRQWQSRNTNCIRKTHELCLNSKKYGNDSIMGSRKSSFAMEMLQIYLRSMLKMQYRATWLRRCCVSVDLRNVLGDEEKKS